MSFASLRRRFASNSLSIEILESRSFMAADARFGAQLVDDRYEENDSIYAAKSVGTLSATSGQSKSTSIDNLVMADSADWYRVRLASTASANGFARIQFDGKAGDLDFAVFDARGSLVGYSDGIGDSETISLAGRSGTFYLYVYGYRGATNPNYKLTVSIDGSTSVPTALPDLRGSSLAATDSSTWGSSITVSGSVRNGGTAGAGSSQAQFYLSKDAIGSADDIPLTLSNGNSNISVGALAAGASTNFSVTLRLPSTAPSGFTSGSYFIILKTDSANQVVESNENNNFGALGDGIDREKISITSPAPAPNPNPNPTSLFNIDLVTSGLTASQQAIFQRAVNRWEQVIVGDIPDVIYQGQRIDDLRVTASAVAIDGAGGVLGQAGPDVVRRGGYLPAVGSMEFDTADIANMERNGSLFSVVLHELGHILGFGTIWSQLGLVSGAGTGSPRFTGPLATAEYNRVFGTNASGVPLETTGGSGTRDSHWLDSLFGAELMTGYAGPGANLPLSSITIAQMADLGYTVNYAAADPYTPLGRTLTSSAIVSASNFAANGQSNLVTDSCADSTTGGTTEATIGSDRPLQFVDSIGAWIASNFSTDTSNVASGRSTQAQTFHSHGRHRDNAFVDLFG